MFLLRLAFSWGDPNHLLTETLQVPRFWSLNPTSPQSRMVVSIPFPDVGEIYDFMGLLTTPHQNCPSHSHLFPGQRFGFEEENVGHKWKTGFLFLEFEALFLTARCWFLLFKPFLDVQKSMNIFGVGGRTHRYVHWRCLLLSCRFQPILSRSPKIPKSESLSNPDFPKLGNHHHSPQKNYVMKLQVVWVSFSTIFLPPSTRKVGEDFFCLV